MSKTIDKNRRIKGRFWNRCEPGLRERICKSMGWNKTKMERYGKYAKEASDMSYADWLKRPID